MYIDTKRADLSEDLLLGVRSDERDLGEGARVCLPSCIHLRMEFVVGYCKHGSRHLCKAWGYFLTSRTIVRSK